MLRNNFCNLNIHVIYCFRLADKKKADPSIKLNYTTLNILSLFNIIGLTRKNKALLRERHVTDQRKNKSNLHICFYT
jgi:hypothetical protein